MRAPRRRRHKETGTAPRAATPSARRGPSPQRAALVVLAALAAVLLRPGRPQVDLRRIDGQNVLLVTIDTLRADALSSYGGQANTPALDRLAAEGVRFDFAHAHAVVTLPSHASILTGEYPFQHGLRDNAGYRLPRGARTAATMLKQAGYATAAFVAAFPLHSRFGLNAGFDVYNDRFGEGLGSADLVTPEGPASAVVPLAREWIAGRGGSGERHGRERRAASRRSSHGSCGSTSSIRTRRIDRLHRSTRSTPPRPITARSRRRTRRSRRCWTMSGTPGGPRL